MKKTKIICILSFVVCLLLGNVVFAVEPSETEETECLSEISVSKEALYFYYVNKNIQLYLTYPERLPALYCISLRSLIIKVKSIVPH